MPHQRRRPVPLHAVAWQDNVLPPARRAWHPRRFAHLPGLQRSPELRFDDRQGHRLRRKPRAGDRADAHRAIRNGRGGYPDQHPAASRPPQRHALRARRSLDPLPRAETGAGAEKKEVMSWLAVTLQVDTRAADALSEALLEAGADSVSLEHPDAPRVELKALFTPQHDAAAVLAAASAACGLATPAFSVERLEDEDWVRRSQSQFAPLLIGRRLWIGPSWHKPPPDIAAVTLGPGLAFGTGSHPTTRLVLRFLERHLSGGERVLDYGCGSGILAIAAAKLGAARIGATDTDPAALETAADNALANGVALELCAPQDLGPGLYDIVVAN